MYADDVTIIEPIFANSDCCPTHNFKSFQEWVTACRMVINYNKTKQIIFRRQKHCNPTFPGITAADNVKVLGVDWESSLSWRSHFDRLLKVSSQRLYIIRILKPFLSTDQLCLVYKSIIVSLLLYAAPLFASLPQNVSQKLEKFNRRVHRLICGEACECNRFPCLSSLRVARATNFFIKCESLEDHPLHSFIPHRMRYSGHFRIPRIHSSRRHNSFLPFMCLLVNRDL